MLPTQIGLLARSIHTLLCLRKPPQPTQRQAIAALTPEQKRLLQVMQQQWLDRATQSIDRDKATAAITAIYAHIGQKPPQVIFVASPAKACLLIALIEDSDRALQSDSLGASLRQPLQAQLGQEVQGALGDRLAASLNAGLDSAVQTEIMSALGQPLEIAFGNSLLASLAALIGNALHAESSRADAAVFEFGKSIGVNMEPECYALYMSYCQEVGWIFPYEKLVVACERPRKIGWDSQDRIHGEGEPAIQFADGFSLWAWHGVRLPQRYRCHPDRWQAQWLLEESNVELRRALLQGIGYSRIVHELGAIELDHWREYTLLQIAAQADVEPIYLLKMVCPSTQAIQVLRVPPDLRSARAAIRWCNWGIDPEAFAIVS
jgi:hypothetical protein